MQAFNLDTSDQALLRELYGCFPTGVTAVCAMMDGAPAGIAASSFTSVSIRPPLVSVCAQHGSKTWPILRRAPTLGITVLDERREDACRALASKDVGSRFAQLEWVADETGAVYIDDASAHLRCEVYEEHEAGDHNIVVMKVQAFWAGPHVPPLVFHKSRYSRLGA